jgi:hypothetical protein
MTRTLASALLDERSVLGFAGGLAEGEGMERGRSAESLQLVPLPADADLLARLREEVHASPSGALSADTELVSEGGVFRLRPKKARAAAPARPPPPPPPPDDPAPLLSPAAAAAAAMFGAAPAPRPAAAAIAALAPLRSQSRGASAGDPDRLFAFAGVPDPDMEGLTEGERWRVMLAHKASASSARTLAPLAAVLTPCGALPFAGRAVSAAQGAAGGRARGRARGACSGARSQGAICRRLVDAQGPPPWIDVLVVCSLGYPSTVHTPSRAR